MRFVLGGDPLRFGVDGLFVSADTYTLPVGTLPADA